MSVPSHCLYNFDIPLPVAFYIVLRHNSDAMSQDEITIAEYRALAEFRFQIRRFLRTSEDLARAAGVEPHQHQLLLAIKGLQPDRQPTIGKLAERLQIQHHTAVELVKRTADRGLVRRRQSEDDLRRMLVEITDSGEQVLRSLSLLHRAELLSAEPALTRALAALPRDRPPP
jgi:DNA-binding MarR family transcriptional regulator